MFQSSTLFQIPQLQQHIQHITQLLLLAGQRTHIQSHSIQMVEQFLQRQKLSHMTQPMGRCQHQQERDTLLPVGGQQRVVELKSRLPQKSQLHQIILFMLIGAQTHIL